MWHVKLMEVLDYTNCWLHGSLPAFLQHVLLKFLCGLAICGGGLNPKKTSKPVHTASKSMLGLAS